MFDAEFFPSEADETSDRYASCPDCGDRLTHRRSSIIWHCHSCGCHWSTEGLDPCSLSYEVEGLGECPTEDYDLGPFGHP